MPLLSRVVTFALLVTTLFTHALPPALVQARPSRTVAVPLAPSRTMPRQLVLAPPTGAGSTGLTPADLPALHQQYEPRQAAHGGLDGSFSILPQTLVTIPDPPLQTETGENAVETIVSIPASASDALILNLTVSSQSWNGYVSGGTVRASIAVQLDPNGPWTNLSGVLTVADAGSGAPVIQSIRDRWINLGSTIPTQRAFNLKLSCNGGYYSLGTCQWSNIRAGHHAPGSGWGFVNDNGYWNSAAPTAAYSYVTSMAPVNGQRPPDGRYLRVETPPLSGYNRTLSYTLYASPLLRVPTFPAATTTHSVTVRLQFARELFNPSGSITSSGSSLTFVPQQGFSQVLWELPPGSSQGWQSAYGAPLSTTYAGQYGHLVLTIPAGETPMVRAFDSITFVQDGQPFAVPLDQLTGKCACEQGGRSQNIFGDPVNTASGAFLLSATDLSLGSAGPDLTFDRTYTSLFADTASYPVTPLGPGWRQRFGAALTLAGTTGGEPNTVIYEAATGNRLRFLATVDGLGYAPAPGVRATLMRQADGTYTLTNRDQSRERFDSQGRLVEQRDPQGHTQALMYDSTGQLATVTDAATGRALTFAYTSVAGQVRMASVTDSANRVITYGYTSGGELQTATDLRGGVTTYAYAGTTHRLTSVTRPDGVTHVTNQYDAQGRVQQQDDAAGVITLYTYTPTPAGGQTTCSTMCTDPT